MRDKSRKKVATISTNSAITSSKMKKRPVQSSQSDQVISEKDVMFRKKSVCNPCNPLHYILGRQINDKVDHCKKLVDARFLNSQNLFRTDLFAHYGCVNAIEFSKQGNMLISGGDDKRVLLWNVQKAVQGRGEPTIMKAQHISNIFCLGYNCSNTKIFSAGNDDQVIVHDLETTRTLDIFRHEKPVYGISPHPHDDNIFASACDDGRILVYDTRGNEDSSESFVCVAEHKDPFQSVMFNPVDPVTVATANTKEGISMWDIRKPLKPVMKYGSEGVNCMNVRFSSDGKILLALRRRLPPVIYAVNSSKHLCQFDHPGYYNSCTMKSCCFTGDNDEYIVSGSDDFNLYMWKIPTDDTVDWVYSAHMILRGHRSIVNQVRYNPASCILASSGVEKIIKVWSPFQLSHSYTGGLKKDDDIGEKQRRVYTHDEYIGLVLRSGQLMTHDYSHQSTNEDQRMMAFFDSLVQREIENWSSEDAPTPQSPTEAENNNASDFNISSDSDDSTMSERQLMRCFFPCSTLNSRSTTNVPERSLESPNRITRLIANRREKLIRLANLDGQPQPKKNTTLPRTNLSSTAENTENAPSVNGSTRKVENGYVTRSKVKGRKVSPLKDVGFKRKCIRSRKSRVRRKQSNKKDDSDSDSDLSSSFEFDDKKEPTKVDYETIRQAQEAGLIPQPSTSSGVMSSGHVTATSIASKSRALKSPCISSNGNSSCSDDSDYYARRLISFRKNIAGKRKSAVTDSDSSAKETEPQKQKVLRSKCKSAPYTRRIKSKRQKTNNDIANCNNQVKKETAVILNSSTSKEVTPAKNTRHITNSDSGITSGVSTVEKNRNSTTEKLNSRMNKGDSSDCERVTKNYEWFKKRVNQARRGYRKRTTLPPAGSSDSSDD